MPTAQDWTLAVLDPEGRPLTSPDPRAGFTSSEIVRGSDGSFTVALARAARPGNWLPTRGDGPFMLMLSLYDTPLASTLTSGGQPPDFPHITAEGCG